MMRKLLQTQCPAIAFLLFCLCPLLLSCVGGNNRSPEGYDLRKPVKRELGKDLNEISGITFYDDRDGLLAISDSKRKVFLIDLGRQKLKDQTGKFYKQGDFEDIVLIDSLLYVLISDGTVLA